MPAAVAALLETLFGRGAADVAAELPPIGGDAAASDAEPSDADIASGEPAGIVDFFEGLIVGGDLTTFVRPFGRAGAQRLDPDAWDQDRARRMIATGACARPFNGGGPVNAWVFLRDAEVETILECYRHDTLGPGGIELELERRLDSILGSLRGVPDLGSRPPQEDPTALLARFPSARVELNSADIERLVGMGEEWLVRQFDDPANDGLVRIDFERKAIAAFPPVMNGTRFALVWNLVTALEEHLHRKEAGRPRKSRKREAGSVQD